MAIKNIVLSRLLYTIKELDSTQHVNDEHYTFEIDYQTTERTIERKKKTIDTQAQAILT